MAAASDILKQGYVKIPSKKLGIWAKRWLVLIKKSSSGGARLDKFRDEAAAQSSSLASGARTMIELRYAEAVDRVPDNVRKYTVIVVDKVTEFQFSADSDAEANCWMTTIQEALIECRKTQNSFKVHMMRDIKMRFHGLCTLFVTSDGVKLIDITNGYEIIFWPFSVVRRYGVERGMLQLETGRSSETGESVFNFTTDDPDAIFECIKETARRSALTSKNGRRYNPNSQNEREFNRTEVGGGSRPTPGYSATGNNWSDYNREESTPPPDYRASVNQYSVRDSDYGTGESYCGSEIYSETRQPYVSTGFTCSLPTHESRPGRRSDSARSPGRRSDSARSPDVPVYGYGAHSESESNYDDIIREKLLGLSAGELSPHVSSRYGSSSGKRVTDRPPAKLPPAMYSCEKSTPKSERKPAAIPPERKPSPFSISERKPFPLPRDAPTANDAEPYSEPYMDMRKMRPFKYT